MYKVEVDNPKVVKVEKTSGIVEGQAVEDVEVAFGPFTEAGQITGEIKV